MNFRASTFLYCMCAFAGNSEFHFSLAHCVGKLLRSYVYLCARTFSGEFVSSLYVYCYTLCTVFTCTLFPPWKTLMFTDLAKILLLLFPPSRPPDLKVTQFLGTT